MTRLLCPSPEIFSPRARIEAGRALDASFVSMDQERFTSQAPRFDAVMVRFNTRVGRDVIGRGSRIRAILSPTTGLDHIDLEVAKRYGVRVFHLRNRKRLLKTVNPTAELTVGLMLALFRHIPAAFEAVKAGQWRAANFRGHEAAGKTIGVIGYGRLGGKVARTARALNMNVLAYDAAAVTMPAFVGRCRRLDDLLMRADVVSIHVPLNEATRGLIGAREIARMRQGAILLNTARGAIVDEKALLNALRDRHLAGAAVDVLDGEWQVERRGHPLITYARKHPNLLITPHIGGASHESVEKTDLDVLGRYLSWIKGRRRS